MVSSQFLTSQLYPIFVSKAVFVHPSFYHNISFANPTFQFMKSSSPTQFPVFLGIRDQNGSFVDRPFVGLEKIAHSMQEITKSQLLRIGMPI